MPGFLTIMTGGCSRIIYTATTVGINAFIAPTGYGLVTVEAIGGGGRGTGHNTAANRAGGGGGAYALTRSLTVTAGTLVYCSVGGQAANSWVNVGTNAQPTTLTVGCVAVGGANSATGVIGVSGGTTGSIGTTIFRGGTATVGSGAAGAGAAGMNGNGSGATAGTGTPMGGGTGGGAGANGTAPGGGAGGGLATGANFTGANGRCRITFHSLPFR